MRWFALMLLMVNSAVAPRFAFAEPPPTTQPALSSATQPSANPAADPAAEASAAPTIALDRDTIDRFAGELVDKQYVHALAVATIDASGTHVYCYGEDGAGRPIDGDSIFEIGSVSKTFTSLLLSEMVQRGELSLDDPIQKRLPDSVKLAPPLAEHPITLVQLATHHSGLPRMPDNFHPKNAENPYVDYTADQLYEFLGAVQPAAAKVNGAYSNMGVGLLGYILSLRADAPYERALTDRVLRPLGMKATSIALSDAQQAKFTHGHDGDGNDVSSWDLAPAFVGAGGVRSTINDMAKYVEAQIDPSARAGSTLLADAIRATHEKRATMDAHSDIGLGWMIDQQRGYLWHNGQTGGYHSFVAFHPESHVGIVLLGDTATGWIDAVGTRLMARAMGSETVDPPNLRPTIKLDDATLDRVVGEYRLGMALLTITRGPNGNVFAQLTGQPKARIYPSSANLYFWKVVDASLMVELPEGDGPATRLTLNQNGQSIPAPRIQPKPAATVPTTRRN